MRYLRTWPFRLCGGHPCLPTLCWNVSGGILKFMRQALLNEVERILPTAVATSKIDTDAFAFFSAGKGLPASTLHHHKKMRIGIDKYSRQAKGIQSLVSIFRKIDKDLMSVSTDNSAEAYGEEAGREVIQRVLNLMDVGISQLDQLNENVFPPIIQLVNAVRSSFLGLRKLVPAHHVMQITLDDSRDLLNGMVAAFEARRDLLLEMKVLRARLELELDGKGVTAKNTKELKRFLTETWA